MVTVQIEMKGIHGHLVYRGAAGDYRIPIEHTGDYKRGLLVFFANIAPSIPDQAKMNVLGQIRRDLQLWAKQNAQPLCW